MRFRSSTGEYPADWPQIAKAVKDAAGWRCVRCDRPHDPPQGNGHILTVHHLDMNKSNCRWWNLAALCFRCHGSIQTRVWLERPYVLFPHSAWFRPYVAGYYACRYAGLDLTRAEVEARLPELLDLERQAMGVAA
jgi:hypothetical protein